MIKPWDIIPLMLMRQVFAADSNSRCDQISSEKSTWHLVQRYLSIPILLSDYSIADGGKLN
jgi:hypothetical protein